MRRYVDGFVFPLKREHVEQYKQAADAVAEIYIEHGAIEYVEFVGDDMQRECTRPFPDVVVAAEDETVVFGWTVFESRESRDAVNKNHSPNSRRNYGENTGRIFRGICKMIAPIAAPNSGPASLEGHDPSAACDLTNSLRIAGYHSFQCSPPACHIA